MSFIYVDEEFVRHLKSRLHQGHPPYDALKRKLLQEADYWYAQGPWTITDYPSVAASGNPHDYYSEGPYWWPDPKDPDGPYIRRDGEYNPDHFRSHRNALEQLCRAVVALSYAGFYLEDDKFTRRAAYVLNLWFLNEDTRMNPHLEYGQAIRGRVEGRGIGIIDTNRLIGLVHALPFLEKVGWNGRERDGVRDWINSYLTWLTESEKGLDEKSERNNHGTYWAAQVGTFAAYVGNEHILNGVFDIYKHKLLPDQVEPNGAQPREEIRTRSLLYSLMNANGLALLCELAFRRGVNLWRYEAPTGGSIERVSAYLAPYVKQPSAWTKQQLDPIHPAPQLFLHWAGLRLSRPEHSRINNALKDEGNSILGLLSLLPGREISA